MRFNLKKIKFSQFSCRALIIASPNIRSAILNARNRMVPRDIADRISKELDIGDWWLVYMMGRNVDPIIFKDLLTELVQHITPQRKQKETNF